MKRLQTLFFSILSIIALLFIGCASSEESSDKKETPPPPVVQKPSEQPHAKPEPAVAQKVDTLNVDIQNTQKPSYEQKPIQQPIQSIPSPQTIPVGKYSVQIGAYKMPDNADRIAALAKERFKLNVYTNFDKTDNLYKVIIGDFTTKEDARSFRDEMATKFPSDYKDAWVSENAQK